MPKPFLFLTPVLCLVLALLGLPCAQAQAPAPVGTGASDDGTHRVPLLGLSLPDLSVRRSTARSPVTEDRRFALRFPVTRRGAVKVATGYTRIVSAPDHFRRAVPAKATWKFKAVPVTVAYEHAPTGRARRVVPTVGAGLSLYFTRMKRLAAPHGAAALVDRPGIVYSRAGPSFAYRYGVGYGAHASLGLRVHLTPRLFLVGQSRLRYIDGLALRGAPLDARFACLDFVLGVGVAL